MRKLRKKLFIIVPCIIILCIIGYFIIYNNTYTIADNKVEIQNALMRFINKPTVITKEIVIKQSVDIDNKKYVLLINTNSINNYQYFDDAELTRGISKRYRIEQIGMSGSRNFAYEVITTNKGKYFIIMGENPDVKISNVKIKLDNKYYNIKIPKQRYFIAYEPVSKNTKSMFPEFNSLRFYDKNNKDITEEMFNFKSITFVHRLIN
ncbi:MAG: hypothetical protein ABF633_19230 [Clostridium sp.]|uniref:hypothetical protein n=1 Tax=Clostridium sp. TaxID=1506 RepID=UPI0039EBB40D